MPYRDHFAQCPRCKLALEKFKIITGHSVQRCLDCAGIWMSPAVFAKLRDILVPDSVPPMARKRTDGGAILFCPECEREMEKVYMGEGGGYLLPGVPREGGNNAIDRCEEHGTWFDQSELQAVLTFLATLTKKPD
jgi:Zn-finger nucleic acid-binding protein